MIRFFAVLLLLSFIGISAYSINNSSLNYNPKIVKKINLKSNLYYPFDQGNMFLSAGIGTKDLISWLYESYNNGGYQTEHVGPYFLKFEYAAGEKFGLGINVNHSSNKVILYNQTILKTLDYTTTSINVRINNHFYTEDNIDVYYGLGLGYLLKTEYWSSTDTSYVNHSVPTTIPIGFEVTLGARYYINKNWGIYSEFGIAKCFLQGGLIFRIE